MSRSDGLQNSESEEVVLDIKDLKKYFTKTTGWIESFLSEDENIKAVDGVDISLKKNEILSIVGESGCGKTTLAKTLIRIHEPTSGDLIFNGQDIGSLGKKEINQIRRNIQLIYQDPFESLNPKKTVREILTQPLEIHDIGSKEEKESLIRETLESVKLTPIHDFLDRYPEELSGGQLQRVLFARSLVLDPEIIIADEPASMLDAGIRAEILDLIKTLRDEEDITFLIITHDIGSARYLGDRIGVMYLGRIVELGDANDIIDNPKHPYSQELIKSIPSPNPHDEFKFTDIEGDIPDPSNLPSGCRFHPRCPMKKDHCETHVPQWREVPTKNESTRKVECHEVEPKQKGEQDTTSAEKPNQTHPD